MARTRIFVMKGGFLSLFLFIALGCSVDEGNKDFPFDKFHREVKVDPWQLRFSVINQNHQHGDSADEMGNYYLKATVSISNSRLKQSLLHSASSDAQDYESHYRYLSFDAQDDLHIQFEDRYLYPIGYVFEPSLGLAGMDRLVYTFQVSDSLYKDLRSCSSVKYWYMERLAGLGSICFTNNHDSDEG